VGIQSGAGAGEAEVVVAGRHEVYGYGRKPVIRMQSWEVPMSLDEVLYGMALAHLVRQRIDDIASNPANCHR
jgi:hypothetical protein